MIVRILILIMLINLATFSTAAGQTGVTGTNDKVRQGALKLASNTNDIADVKMLSGERRTGKINSVNADSFDLFDTKSGRSQTILFSEVKHISKHRNGLGAGAWIAIGAAAAGAIIVAAVLSRRFCNEQRC